MKKIIFTVIILILICLISELALFLCCFFKGLNVDKSELISYREKVLRNKGGDLAAPDPARGINNMEIHPFFGYVHNPKLPGVNNFGFLTKYNITLLNGKYSLLNINKEKAFVIGIFGSSFAEEVGHESEFLEKEISALFPEKVPVVINFGIGGHAFPEEAFIFTYFKELLDVAVFVDGLSEIWNLVDNNNAGCPPEYAKAVDFQYKLSLNRMSPEVFTSTARILAKRKSIVSAARASLLPIIKRSLLAHYVWVMWTRLKEREIYLDFLTIKKSYESQGKFFDVSDDAILDFAVERWKSYHCLIHNIASSQNILNIHLLHPNPFVAGSKHLTNEERKLITNSYPVKDVVLVGYPKLQRSVMELKKTGLITEDLSYIFKEERKNIWIDSCHANKAGSEIILRKIAELIKNNYK